MNETSPAGVHDGQVHTPEPHPSCSPVVKIQYQYQLKRKTVEVEASSGHSWSNLIDPRNELIPDDLAIPLPIFSILDRTPSLKQGIKVRNGAIEIVRVKESI